MTDKQKYQFNRMLEHLKRIKRFQTPAQLRRNSDKQYGLPYEEALEYAYENVKAEASKGMAGVRAIK